MTSTFKHSTLGLSIVLLLAACGGQSPATLTPTPQNPGIKPPVQISGFAVDGKTDLVARKIALPARQTMRMPAAGTLGAQAVSSLPAWTGPRLFDSGLAGTAFATNSKGELFVNQIGVNNADSLSPLTRFSKFSSIGQGIGFGEFDLSGGDRTRRKYSDYNWLVVTEGNPEQEAYQLAIDKNSQVVAQIYSASTALLNKDIEPIIATPFDLFPLNIARESTKMKANGTGLVVSSVGKENVYGGDKVVSVSEVGYEPWGEIGLRIDNKIRVPKAYGQNYTASDFAVGSDGSVYVAVFTSYIGEQCVGYFQACPSVAGITKFTGEDVAWQVYWDADEPVLLKDVAVSDSAVSLLVNVGTPDESGNYVVTPTQSTLQTFSLDGVPISNIALPVDSNADSAVLQGLEMNTAGKMVGFNTSTVLAGTQAGGFTKSMSLKTDYGNNPANTIQSVSLSGDYLYVSGRTQDSLGSPKNPLPRSPYDYTLAINPAGNFVLPLDINLNRRF